MSTSRTRRSRSFLRTATVVIVLLLSWTTLWLFLESTLSVLGFWRYRSAENGDLATAEMFDTATLVLARSPEGS